MRYEMFKIELDKRCCDIRDLITDAEPWDEQAPADVEAAKEQAKAAVESMKTMILDDLGEFIRD